MQKVIWRKHPFPLLFYLEWILLGIALLAAFSLLIHPHPLHPRHLHGVLRPSAFPPLGLGFRLGVLVSIAALGLMGLRLPFGSRLFQGLYTTLGFGLSWLAVMLGGRVERILPAMLLIVVMRACLLFPWSGRTLVAIFAYISFLSIQFMSLLRMSPLGIPLGRALPPRLQRMPSELLQGVLVNLMINSALLFGLVLVFVLLLVGALVAEKQSRQELALANRRLRQYALLIENQATLQERNRIAREIHDSVGHSLTAQSIQLENVAMLLLKDITKTSHHLQKARQLGKEALQNVRQSVATLRNYPLQGKSLPVALTKLLQEFEEIKGIKVNSQIKLKSSLSTEIAIALYRVIQEALTNISKHSNAQQVYLHLRENIETISLVLEDNGQGFKPVENTTGFGLKGMRERIEVLGGTFALTSNSGEGCQIRVDIPLSGET